MTWLADLALSVAALVCIETTVLGESRGEPEIGQAMVRRVILNRAEDSGEHPCSVVSKPRQFAGFSLSNIQHFDRSWWDRQVMVRRKGCGEATHFHATWDKPRWSKSPKMRELCRIKGHIFYVEEN